MNLAAVWRPITVRLVVCWSAFAGCALAQEAGEHANHEKPGNELVLFLSAEAHHIDTPVPLNTLNEDAWFSADIVLALTRDRFRLFGEYLWSTEEHHHGRYLQTSITRPAIERWEDENGIIPQHIAGVLFDSRFPLGDLGGMQV